ncbi:MAG: hypothetical protein ACJ71Z_04765 [Aeromicrobium sp.]
MVGVRARPAFVAAVVAIAAALGIGIGLGGSAPAHGRGGLGAAAASLPKSTTVLGFTDWQHIVDRYDLSEASQRDLVTRSVLVDDPSGVKRWLGVGLHAVAWEAYGQWPAGEAAVLRLKGSMPSAARLRKSGYREKDGVWNATGRLAADEPIYASVARLPRDGVIVIGARPGAVGAVRDVIRGRLASMGEDRSVADVVQGLSGVQTALIQTSRLGCVATKVAVEPERARQAAAAEARFGRLVPYSVLGRGLRDDQSDTQRFAVAMTFGSAVTAAKQSGIRAALSHGPFLGRSGDISEVLRIRSSRSDGPVALLSYDHPADSEYLMTGHGPLMPASC